MATYGAREENRFKLNGVTYYPLVDSTTGKITLKQPILPGDVTQSADNDRTVGTIEASGSKAKKFQENPGQTTSSELEFFSKQENVDKVRGQAQKTALKAQLALGIEPESAKARTNELLNKGTTTTTPVKLNPEESSFSIDSAVTNAGQIVKDLSIPDSEGIRQQYGNWKYPITFPEKQDRMKFTMFRYIPRSFDIKNASNDLVVSGERAKPGEKNIMGTVTLPISPTISDQNSVDWGSPELNAFQALAAAASYGAIKTGKVDVDAVIEGLAGQEGPLKAAAAAYLAGQAAGTNTNLLSRIGGAVLNPNLELLFNGPQLRTFSFSFTMSAREPDEAKQIRNIIRFFKQGMAVKRATTNLFLKAPNIFDIQYIYGQTDHPWINKIKTCALTNCQVNYTPAGNYATFNDGAMTAYELTLSFNELDPIFEDDYDDPKSFGKSDTFIGY